MASSMALAVRRASFTRIADARRVYTTIYFDISTVQGVTDHRGLLERGYTCKLQRRLSPSMGDRFLRWCDLPADAPLPMVA